MRKLKPSYEMNSVILNSLPLLLDEKAAAQYLGVSVSYLRKSRSEGSPGKRTPAPTFVRVDGRVYYKVAALTTWADGLESQRVV